MDNNAMRDYHLRGARLEAHVAGQVDARAAAHTRELNMLTTELRIFVNQLKDRAG